MKTFAKGTTIALAIAAFAMACADAATSPSDQRLPVPGSVSSAVSNSEHTFPPGFPIGEGDVEVCKTTNAIPLGIPVADRTFSFTVTSTGAGTLPNPAPSIIVPDGGGTACVVVYTSLISLGGGAEEVVITEGANEPNFALTAINTIRFLASVIVAAGGYNDGNCVTNNCLDDFETFGSRRATVYINNDMARRVTFTNTFTPPPVTGCTYTKGWYQNPNGAPTVTAVDNRTKTEAQTILASTPSPNPNKNLGVTWGSDNLLHNLYQQLLTALLNLGGNGHEHDGPAAVDQAIDDALAGTGGSGLNITTTLTHDEMAALVATLSAFNEGTFPGWPHCGD